MIQTVCPHCQRSVSFRDILAGLSVKCPECPGFIQLPSHPPARTTAEPAAITAEPPREPVVPEPLPDTISSEPTPPSPPTESLPTEMPHFPDVALPASPWRRRLKWAAILVAVPLLLAPFAWLLGGETAWLVVSVIGAVGMLGGTVVAGKEWLTGMRRHGLQPELPLSILYGWAVVGGWYWLGSLQIPGVIHVENASTREVQIELDGQPWVTSAPGQFRRRSVRHGPYRVTVRALDNDQVLDELHVRVEKRGTYVLNVLRAGTFYRGEIVYGKPLPLMGRDEEQVVKDAWIDVTMVDFLFEDPPQTITVKRDNRLRAGFDWQSRTYFTRRPPAARP